MAKSFTVVYYGSFIKIVPGFLDDKDILDLDDLIEEIDRNYNPKNKLDINYMAYIDANSYVEPITEEEVEILYEELDVLLESGDIDLVDFFEITLNLDENKIIDTVDI